MERIDYLNINIRHKREFPCTSISQSCELLRLGLHPLTADMYHEYIGTNVYSNTPKVRWYDSFDKDDIPAWSLFALIQLLPKNIIKIGYNLNEKYKNNSCQFYLNILPYYKQQVAYEAYLDGEIYYLWKSNSYNLFSNVIDCIKWLVENKYIDKKYLEPYTNNLCDVKYEQY